jgi:hypothetical protein
VYDGEEVDWSREVPTVISKSASTPANEEEMKIAFRYSDVKSDQKVFDISKNSP